MNETFYRNQLKSNHKQTNNTTFLLKKKYLLPLLTPKSDLRLISSYNIFQVKH